MTRMRRQAWLPRLTLALVVVLPVAVTVSVVGTGTAQASTTSPSTGLVIDAIYGGGGDSTNPSNLGNDFVELFNAGTTPQSLNGMSLQYAAHSATQVASPGYLYDLPNVTLGPGQHFLFEGATGTNGADSPLSTAPDGNLSTFNLSDQGATVFLVDSTSLLPEQTVSGIQSDPSIVDEVGYGNGASGKYSSDLYLGTAPAADETDTTALFRKDNGCQNTNQNENDFVLETALTATLYDMNSPPTPCSGLLISAIYGGGGDSSTVTDLANDFVELFNAGTTPQTLNGLSIQYATYDGTFDPADTVDLPNEMLEPGQYFLFAGGSDTGTSPTDLADGPLSPPPDDDDPSTASSYNASDEGGTVFLVNGTNEISAGSSTAIIDEVGYGNGAGGEESTEYYLGAPTPDTSATTGLFRNDNGCANTLNNANDFSVETAAATTLYDRESPTQPCNSGLTGAATVTTPSITLGGGGLYNPAGIATNNNGTAYFSDTYENVIGSIAGSTDSVVAGSFEGYGESGDGGPATPATLYSPAGLAVDSQGDIFVADTDDNVVREVTTNGEIHLFAGTGTAGYTGDGGQAVDADLDGPEAVAVDTFGDVFIADSNNNVVREVTPSGIISTIAGDHTAGYSGDNGPAVDAELNDPCGVAVDSLGDVYIADSANNVIRRVGTDGTITTVAGDYQAYMANGDVAADSGDGGPATQAQLNDPEGITLDRAGDLFIADTYNDAVREVSPSGTISTLVGNTVLDTPEAVAVDNSSGDVYIADTANNAIREVVGLSVPGPAAGGPVAPLGANLPESPVDVALPLLALTVMAGGLFVARRRPRRRTDLHAT
jgi:hypothetical protein